MCVARFGSSLICSISALASWSIGAWLVLWLVCFGLVFSVCVCVLFFLPHQFNVKV